MYPRAFVMWFVLLCAAIGNGALREALIIPRTGDYWGHVASTLTLSALILGIAVVSAPWMGLASTADALRVGALWVAMTMAFEFLAGHYLFGNSWERLLADYNILQGRIWILVLVVTFVAPLVARARPGR